MQESVLVVDDDADVRQALIEVLEGEGLRAFGAADGHVALDLIRQAGAPIGLVLLDARMPGIDGESFLRIRAQDPEVRAIPVIVFSADRGLAPVIRGHAATEYVLKPCTRDTLLEAVARHLPP